jgi:hypothetical protein
MVLDSPLPGWYKIRLSVEDIAKFKELLQPYTDYELTSDEAAEMGRDLIRLVYDLRVCAIRRKAREAAEKGQP